MTHLNETLYCCGIACSSQGFQTKAGNYQIDLLLANVRKQNVTRFPMRIVRLAEDVAGGLMVTMPSEGGLQSPARWWGRNGETIGEICNKFFKGPPGVHGGPSACDAVPGEHLPGCRGGWLPYGVHARSRLSQAQRIMISGSATWRARSSWPGTLRASITTTRTEGRRRTELWSSISARSRRWSRR